MSRRNCQSKMAVMLKDPDLSFQQVEVIEFRDSYEAPANDPSTTTTNTTSGEAGMKSGRTVTLTTEDMQKKKNDVKFMDVEVEQDDLNQKFLTSLAPEWLMHTIVWRNISDLNTMSLDDLYNHLKVYEIEVQNKTEPNTQNMAFISSAKHSRGNDEVNTASSNVPTASANVATVIISQETACAYIASQSSGLDFVMKKKACFNCGDFNHLAYECRKRVKKGTTRKFFTASRKFPTGSTKNPTADMGLKGKAVKPSPYWTWKPLQNLSNKVPRIILMTKAIGTVAALGGCKITRKGTIKTGTKVDARQDVKKDVSSLRYIVLPNWVHEEHLESTLSQPQDACNTDAPESSGNSNPTATLTNPSANQLETLIVETPIPTVSSPVLIACCTDSQEPSSETRLILKRVTNQEETPSLDNILTLTNQFEDILGVTTNLEESNGVEADISNIETTITASPTPTLRIHINHPKSQIIGPADTPIRTRNKSKEVGEQSFIATIHQKTDPALLQFYLFSCFLSQVEPNKISDALQDLSWVEAMQEELLQFKIQK
nr:hypothetical protein [Tanacetum cinerariifolium]